MTQQLIWALTTGLLGSLGHCLGMCGPIVLSLGLPHGRDTSLSRLVGLLLYQLGRISTYGFIGAFMALSGHFASTAGQLRPLQNAVAVIAGLLMIAMGLGMSGAIKILGSIESGLGGRLQGWLHTVLNQPGQGRLYVAGLLLGYLPCGLSYSIFVASAAQQGPLQGGALALSFGLGTLPALLAAGFLSRWLSARLRSRLYRLGGVSVAGMGVWYVIRVFVF